MTCGYRWRLNDNRYLYISCTFYFFLKLTPGLALFAVSDISPNPPTSTITIIIIIIIIYSLRVFHISVRWWSFNRVWVTTSLLKSPGLFLSFFLSFFLSISFAWFFLRHRFLILYMSIFFPRFFLLSFSSSFHIDFIVFFCFLIPLLFKHNLLLKYFPFNLISILQHPFSLFSSFFFFNNIFLG